eukprot:91966_1
MPGKPKRSGKGKGGKDKRRISTSKRAGLAWPVGRVKHEIRRGRFAPRIGATAAIYLAAVLEYTVAEVIELSGNAAQDHKKKTIGPRHVMLALRGDEELNKLTSGCTIPYSGVPLNIHDVLKKKKKKKKKKQSARLHAF